MTKTLSRRESRLASLSRTEIAAKLSDIKRAENLRKAIDKAGIEEILDMIKEVIVDITTDAPKSSSVQLYRELARLMPGRMSEQRREKIVSAIGNTDPNIAKIATQVATLVFASTIINAIDKYLTGNQREDEDILHDALGEIYGEIRKVRSRSNFRILLYNIAGFGVQRHIAEKEMMPLQWVRERKEDRIREAVDKELEQHGFVNGEWIKNAAARIASDNAIRPKVLARHIKARLVRAVYFNPDSSTDEIADPEQIVAKHESENLIKRILTRLSPREEMVLRRYYGIGRAYGCELEEVGVDFRRSKANMGRVKDEALERFLRHYRKEEPKRKCGDVSRIRLKIRRKYPLREDYTADDQYILPSRKEIR